MSAEAVATTYHLVAYAILLFCLAIAAGPPILVFISTKNRAVAIDAALTTLRDTTVSHVDALHTLDTTFKAYWSDAPNPREQVAEKFAQMMYRLSIQEPRRRYIGLAETRAALADGWRDFRQAVDKEERQGRGICI